MGNKTEKRNFFSIPTVGDVANSIINVMPGVQLSRFISNGIRDLAVRTGSEAVRNVASVVTIPNNLMDSAQARVNSAILSVYPGWLSDKAEDRIGKGRPVWSIDKEHRIARYYDSKGKQQLVSPVGIGLVQGDKSVAGDNRTPTGTYTLSAPERGSGKTGGEMSFGPYFYRTNHKNNKGGASGVGLHGTGMPIFNGSNISHGCMRVDNSTIKQFYKKAPNRGAGTRIIISD